MSALAYASDHAAAGFRILPLRPLEKLPAIAKWQHAATNDVEQVRKWLQDKPDAGYGIVCGGGLLVLDVDTKDGAQGFDTLAALESQHGALPKTWQVRTPSGGAHYYFMVADESSWLTNSASKLGPGLDIRAGGKGYVVGPGTRLPTGTYEVLHDAPIALCPDWLLSLLAPKPRGNLADLDVKAAPPKGDRYTVRALESAVAAVVTAPEGGRNDTLNREAHGLFRLAGAGRIDPAKVEDAMRRAANAAGLEPDEVEATLESARVGLQSPNTAGLDTATAAPSTPATALSVAIESALRPVTLDSQDDDAPRFVVHPILPRRVVTLLGAHGGAGKTQLALVIAAHCAAGVDWGGFKFDAPSRVVFATLEDEAGLIRSRLKRIVRHYGLDRATVWQNFRLLDGTELTQGLAFEARFDGVTRIHAAAEFAELESAAADCDLLIVDNASDGFNGNENDRSQVRQFIRGMLGKIARCNDCAVLLLAHIDKHAAKNGALGNSYSGSTAWHNSARSRLALLIAEGVIQLVHEKCNFAKTANSLRLYFADDGVIAPVPPRVVGTMTINGQEFPAHGDPIEEDLFECLRAAIETGETVYTSESGTSSAFAVCRDLPNFPRAIRKAAPFYSYIRRLERAERLVRETYKTASRKTKERWALPPSAPNAPNAPNDVIGAIGTGD